MMPRKTRLEVGELYFLCLSSKLFLRVGVKWVILP